MDLRNLLPLYYDFYVVAKEKNITKASLVYHIAQPTLSKNIKTLESILKCDLISRTNKGIELTLDGELVYKKLDTLFQSFYEQKENVKNEDLVGNIMIGTTRNIADNRLNLFLSAFYKMYPKVKINIFTDSASNLNTYLMNHKIDVLIDYLPNINYSEKYELEVQAIGHFNTCFACSKAFYESNKERLKHISDLNHFQLVIPGSSRRRQMLDDVLQEHNLSLTPIVEMPDSKLMIDFVTENDCIGYFIKEELEESDLVEIPLQEAMPQNSYGIIYYKNTLNILVERFVKLVLDLSND